MKKTIPAISIIIPMYNVEKYIGECLDSILAQTFTDYEVIIVDDCSTDKSCEVVESYMKKFNKKFENKLQLIRSKKNSGGAAVPRNIGLNMSCGEYVLFMDSDDALTSTALKEMHTLAKKFDVDVVYCEKFFGVSETIPKIHDQKNLTVLSGEQHEGFVIEPTVETNDLPTLVKKFCSWHFEMPPWDKLVKRDLLIKNNITFPKLRSYDDLIWTFEVLCSTEKILRAPIATYIHRYNAGSITSKKDTPEKNIVFWTGTIIDGLKILEDFMLEFEFLRKNIGYRYAVMDFFAHLQLRPFVAYTNEVPPAYIYAVLNQTNTMKFGDNDALISYLLTALNMKQKVVIQANRRIIELQEQIQQLQSQLNAK